ncbi:MAG: FAD-binding oxidoreductase [Acidiferrobacterales bacterium]|nr:FAD-binding oxidoreductase [Acidiferrobacterales bacterium]
MSQSALPAVEQITHPIGDFSGMRSSIGNFPQYAPHSAQDVINVVKHAVQKNHKLRFRAQGHSLNGGSLPKPEETLIVSHKLQQVRFKSPGTVCVGSGVVLWTLQDILKRVGFALPMYNDGYPGPTVGGYIGAGGIGPGSIEYGGFWNNVASVKIVDGLGELHEIHRGDEIFNWLFGSMGQLGYIVEATLKIIPSAHSHQPRYATGYQVTAPFLEKPVIPLEFQLQENQGLFWFTLVCPTEHLEVAHSSLKTLERSYHGVLQFQERYSYQIKYLDEPTPPLFHPYQGDLVATGAWGWLLEISEQGLSRLLEFDDAFTELTTTHPHYRRYIQSELPNAINDFRRCFGEEVYGKFESLKNHWDPHHVFNAGSVFIQP